MFRLKHLFSIPALIGLAVPLQMYANEPVPIGQSDSIPIERTHRFHGAYPIPSDGLTLGVFWLPDVDYSEYGGPEVPDFLEQDLGRSFSITIPFIGLIRNMNKAKTLQLETSLEMSIHNLVFSNSFALTRMPGIERIYPIPVEPELKKSKLCLTYFELPVRITVRNNHARRLFTAGIVPGLLLNEHTKTKKPKEKERLHSVENFRCNAEIRCWLHPHFYLSGTYSLTPMFKHHRGPETYPVTFGIGWRL